MYLKSPHRYVSQIFITINLNIQGCVAQIKKQKENQRAQELAAVKAFVKEKVNKNTTEAIEKAKQRIFDESCYGKKLLRYL